MMKAAIARGYIGHNASLVEVASMPRPGAQLGPGEVLVRVYASSVNPVDWKLAAAPGWGLHFPVILGMDLAGVVVAVGSGCARLREGDEVWSDHSSLGSYAGAHASHPTPPRRCLTVPGSVRAEYVVAEELNLGLKPRSLSWTEAASLPLVAMTSLASFDATHAPWTNAPTIVILGGTGGCGSAGIEMAKAFGAGKIIATGSNITYMRNLGADIALDFRQTNWWDVVPDGSVQIVYDTVGLQVIRHIGAEGLDRRGPAGSCRLFLGPGFRLGACWNRLVETVKTRKKREKTGKKWARYGLKRVKEGS